MVGNQIEKIIMAVEAVQNPFREVKHMTPLEKWIQTSTFKPSNEFKKASNMF